MILADGESVRDLVPDDVRLIEIEEGHTIGEKRNFGASHARGSVIAHWDDDDYSAPERLTDQVARLTESQRAVTGYRSILFSDGQTFWRYQGDIGYAVGTSLVYRKDWWLSHPFPPKHIGEDGDFVRVAQQSGQLTSVDCWELMLATVHKGNTCPRQIGHSEYSELCPLFRFPEAL